MSNSTTRIPVLTYAPAKTLPGGLLRSLLWLALPILAEQTLHMLVGLNDTYLANTLPGELAAPSAAAVGTMAYILWFIGLIVGTIGTGSTAIIARAKGARHRSLANSVTGQSITAAVCLGVILGLVAFVAARPVVLASGLTGRSADLAVSYLRILSVSLPLSTLMFTANACLRGAGDAVTPMVSMAIVDVVNLVLTWGLTRGLFGLPAMGFDGIAVGTMIAYITGGTIQLSVLLWGRRGVRLYIHRLRPHWLTLKRVLRIGLPAGAEGFFAWIAHFIVLVIINHLDPTNVYGAAHINTIRIESISFMGGFAFAMAAATMVGQSLGMKNPERARRAAYLAYAVGGGAMTCWGLVFILFGPALAAWMLPGQTSIAELTGACIRVAGFAQAGFAASAVFSGALRGAGDTFTVMVLNLASTFGVRLAGVLFAAYVLRLGLVAIWIVLSIELCVRGLLTGLRFIHGGWQHVKV